MNNQNNNVTQPTLADLVLHYEFMAIRAQSIITQILKVIDASEGLQLPDILDTRARKEVDALLVHEKEVNHKNIRLLYNDLETMIDMRESGSTAIDAERLAREIHSQRQAIESLEVLNNEDLLEAAYVRG